MHDIRRRIQIGILAAFAFALSARAGEKSGPVDLLKDAEVTFTHIEEAGSPALDWQKSLSFEKPGKAKVISQAVFQLKDATRFAGLALEKPLSAVGAILNDKKIPLPLEGMRYRTIPGIQPSLLKIGKNVLITAWTIDVQEQKDEKTGQTVFLPQEFQDAGSGLRLLGLEPGALAIETGPILGYAGPDFFTVACRTNMQSEAVLKANDRTYTSEPNFLHAFKVTGLMPGTEYRYTLTARFPGKENITAAEGPHIVRTLPVGENLVFAALGDSRTYPRDWARVSAAVVKAKPAFSVFAGDMVAEGLEDHQWDEQYFGPAKEYFAAIPYYAVIGNHEQDCPLFLKIFQTPNGRKNWSQEIGSVLLIGIDGGMNWEAGGALATWLENILSRSQAKFIFLATHYPAWSSGGHGKLNKDGRPAETAVRLAREVIMPILKKYDATAMLAGHDHFYERSEPEEGVTMIITGGAGAPLRDKSPEAKRQNPYSRVFVKTLHYCLFTIDGRTCTMNARTPEGDIIDTRKWTARTLLNGY